MADTRTISQLEAEGYPWISCEYCNSNPMIVDQAAINAGFAFRRYAMKPMPAKPISWS